MNFGQTTTKANGQEVVEKHPNKVWLRYSYDESEEWSKVSLLKGRRKTQPNVDVPLPCMYPNGHGIHPNKIADLRKWFHTYHQNIANFIWTYITTQPPVHRILSMMNNAAMLLHCITFFSGFWSYISFIYVMHFQTIWLFQYIYSYNSSKKCTPTWLYDKYLHCVLVPLFH